MLPTFSETSLIVLSSSLDTQIHNLHMTFIKSFFAPTQDRNSQMTTTNIMLCQLNETNIELDNTIVDVMYTMISETYSNVCFEGGFGHCIMSCNFEPLNVCSLSHGTSKALIKSKSHQYPLEECLVIKSHHIPCAP